MEIATIESRDTRRVRARRPKVRTGCVACKARRLKCDETKPKCLRCIKVGSDCSYCVLFKHENGRKKEGFPSQKSLPSGDTPPAETSQELVSQDQNSVLKSALLSLNKPSREPSRFSFETEIEGRYYRLFAERTASNLGDHFSPQCWISTIVQASQRVPSIRHITTALAALDLSSISSLEASSSESSSSSLGSCKPSSYARQKHQFALQQYSKAITEMRKDVIATKQDLRTTLISTILIVWFEAYHGNFQAALSQFRSGYQVLEEWKSEHEDLLTEDFASPPTSVVDSEVLNTFYLLEVGALLHTESLSQSTPARVQRTRTSAMAPIINPFKTIDEATYYWSIILRRTTRFIALPWTSDYLTASATKNYRLRERIPHPSDPAAFIEQEKHLQDLHQFQEAFKPLFFASRGPESQHKFFIATTIQIHCLTAYIRILSRFADSEMFYDTLHPYFVSILSLSLTIHQTDPRTRFTAALRAIIALDLVAKKCRDSVIRKEAIRLLLATPRRECLWDSVIAGKVCKWVVDMEEEGMVDGFVPAECRVWDVRTVFGEDNRWVSVSCLQVGREDEGEVLRRCIINL